MSLQVSKTTQNFNSTLSWEKIGWRPDKQSEHIVTLALTNNKLTFLAIGRAQYGMKKFSGFRFRIYNSLPYVYPNT